MIQRFYSTKSPEIFVDVKEAVLRSLPSDNGLYMPENLEELPAEFWKNWREMSFSEMGFHIARQIFRESVPEEELRRIVKETLSFKVPVVKVTANAHVLELFHGPTLAFKDFGARFMARLMCYLTRNDDGLLTVLVATSGDTGGAVASAFHNIEGTRVIILYPKGKVSGLQEKQLTTLGGNITALEIEGTFDDCQRMVKSAFLDREMSERFNLTSANSINISRLVPQSFYYFEAARQFENAPVFVIPSGNFGNLTAGLLAEKIGLKVKHFVAATNANDVVPAYLESGKYEPRESVATISNAMDVGAPSNFARMENLFGGTREGMISRIRGYAFSDELTRETIGRVMLDTGYMLDPHGAVGWLATEAWRDEEGNRQDETILLETAHPSKFLDVMEEELGQETIEIPERLACLADREKVAIQMEPDEATFHRWLQSLAE